MSQIVLIEDDLFFSSKIENVLKNSEYDLKIFPRGIEALKSLRENPAVLILINLASHSLNPLNLISDIKTDPDLKIIPITGKISLSVWREEREAWQTLLAPM